MCVTGLNEVQFLTWDYTEGSSNISINSLRDDSATVDGFFRRSSIAKFVNAGPSSEAHSVGYGLFCFENFRQNQGGEAFLFNPVRRRELMMLPKTEISKLDNCSRRFNPSWMNTHSFGLGFDCVTGIFKLVHLSSELKAASTQPFSLDTFLTAEVYELGTKSWRQIAVTLNPATVFLADTVSAYGDLHWLARSDDCTAPIRGSMIISFDSKLETFRLTPHPHHPATDRLYLFEQKGVLSLTDWSCSSHIDVWFLKDYEKKEWRKGYRLCMDDFTGKFASIVQQECDKRSLFIVDAWEDGLVFLTKRGQLLLYDRSGYLRILHFGVAGWPLKFNCSMLSLKSYRNLVGRDDGDEEVAAYDLAAFNVDRLLKHAGSDLGLGEVFEPDRFSSWTSPDKKFLKQLKKNELF